MDRAGSSGAASGPTRHPRLERCGHRVLAVAAVAARSVALAYRSSTIRSQAASASGFGLTISTDALL
jgi:hypothetical protein